VTLLVVAAVSAWHLVAIVAWMAPSSMTRDQVVRATRKYVRLTKSDQNWGMFAPDPLSVNRRIIVRAELEGSTEESPNVREEDITSPANRAMRSWSLQRVGKTLKAHDRLSGGDEPGYMRGFALHVCARLAKQWGTPLKKITLVREYELLNVDPRTMRTTRTPTARSNMGEYACAP
jgi:hypothetical protein